MQFEITREIGIDAAHRVMNHESKCRNLHGHRYTIHVTVVGELKSGGAEDGMVTDFSILKDLMMEYIDKPCDHGLILSIHDPIWQDILPDIREREHAQRMVDKFGNFEVKSKWGKSYMVPFTPTAENLAAHWYSRLGTLVVAHSKGNAAIQRVRVWETPNSYCDYPSSNNS